MLAFKNCVSHPSTPFLNGHCKEISFNYPTKITTHHIWSILHLKPQFVFSPHPPAFPIPFNVHSILAPLICFKFNINYSTYIIRNLIVLIPPFFRTNLSHLQHANTTSLNNPYYNVALSGNLQIRSTTISYG